MTEIKDYAELLASQFGFREKYTYTILETLMTIYDETVIDVLVGDLEYYLEMIEMPGLDNDLPAAINVLYDIEKYAESYDVILLHTPYVYKIFF